jgi:hypothetical protein
MFFIRESTEMRIRIKPTIGVIVLFIWPMTGLGISFRISGPNLSGNRISVSPRETFTVDVLMEAPESGNTFEVFLGFDTSSAATFGKTGSPQLNKLILMSSQSEIAESIDSEFSLYRNVAFASGREMNHAALGGRPYGLKVVGARSANTEGGSKKLFSVRFRNNIPAGQYYSLVISDAGTGASYTTGWKHGITSNRGSYVLQVNSVRPTIPGDANRDSKVDVGDLGILAANYGLTAGATWEQGDFNGDQRVDVGDLGILAANYGSSTFAGDYAQVFHSDVRANLQGDSDEEIPGCTHLGLPLVGGMILLCLAVTKLDEGEE